MAENVTNELIYEVLKHIQADVADLKKNGQRQDEQFSGIRHMLVAMQSLDLLVKDAQKVLLDQGQKDVAAKVYRLFHEVHSGGVLPDGEIGFEANLAAARVADVEKHTKDPSARRLQVEDALYVTLKKNGIILPQSFFTAASDFKPKHPVEDKEK